MRRLMLLQLFAGALVALGAIGAFWRFAIPRLSPRAATTASSAAAKAVPRLAPGTRRLLLVMVDGLPVEAFDSALASGDMPHLSRLLRERPTVRVNALSSFPSATAPSLPELLSGMYADVEDLPAPGAVHAFDRAERRVVRYVTEPDAWRWPLPNLFDAIVESGLSAVTVFEGRWEGPEAILTTAAVARAAALEVIGASDLASGDRGPVRAFLARTDKRGFPHAALLVFSDVDLKGHFHGPGSVEVRSALRETDALLGEVFGAMRAELRPNAHTLLDETTLVLFGDHGMVPSGRWLDLAGGFFRARGLAAYDASTLTHVVLRERLGSVWTRWPDAILVSGGSNITQVYLRDPDGGWVQGDGGRRRPDVDEIARELAEEEGVGQVLRLTDSVVEVRAAGGTVATVVERGAGAQRRFAYVVPAEAARDPFGYLADERTAPLVCRAGRVDEACFFSRDAWNERTLDARMPGAVPLLHKAFHPQRFTGDLMVTARPGWSFIKNQHGDHGNLEREAMLTPLVLNGPGIEPGEVPRVVRLVDVYPTAAVLLGADPHDEALAALDGRALPVASGPGQK